ncbi:MAG: extracellular solute-binding protein [Inquilinaceae bacterium]
MVARADAPVTVTHALAEFGTPKYGPDFTHFDYADPDAPKGGRFVRSLPGSFDSLNFWIVRGEYPRNIGLIYDQLMVEPQDERGVTYGLLAETAEYPEDRSWIVFTLRSEARWHDGTPITADDVVWTFETLREVANPFLVSGYEAVESVEALDPRRVRFTFSSTDTMQPLVRISTLGVLPKHYWTAEGRDISRTFLEPPLGSGPYRLVRADAGRTLVYERVEDYWAADLPVMRGQMNFDRVQYDYYQERDIEFEAFKAGSSDFREEFTSLFWGTGYDVPAVNDGRLIREEIPVVEIRGLQGYFMNTRRPPFDDIRVRRALSQLYDFEWVNRNLFFGLYKPMDTYFLAPGYSARGLPEGQELALLEPYRGQVPDAVFTEPFTLPQTDGSGRIRNQIREAIALLAEAGWEVRNGTMTNVETGRPLTFEIIYRSSLFERVTLPYVENLKRIGVEVSLRQLDTAQFQLRYDTRDFDMTVFAYTFYPPPGELLRSYFGSAAADIEGSGNIMGIKDPAVDGLIETILAARDLETKQAGTRALDRVLLHSYYAVPQWYRDTAWIAYWDRFGFPENHPPYDFAFGNAIAFQPTWWIDPAKDAALDRAGR